MDILRQTMDDNWKTRRVEVAWRKLPDKYMLFTSACVSVLCVLALYKVGRGAYLYGDFSLLPRLVFYNPIILVVPLTVFFFLFNVVLLKINGLGVFKKTHVAWFGVLTAAVALIGFFMI